MKFEGIIIKSVGGIYYVDALDGYNQRNVKCTARGIFRKKGISPAAGDYVTVDFSDDSEPIIEEIHERKNYLPRPPLANLDKLVFVNSCAEPAINRFILDKLLVIADSKDIEPIIVFTKIDLNTAGDFPKIYRSIGIPVIQVNNIDGSGSEELKKLISGKISAFVGNSGVGKSSLLNNICPELELETAEISRKLGRGRHTTRTVQLFPALGGYIADTPGFSTVEVDCYCDIPAEELCFAFREFRDYIGKCRFSNCSHTKEQGCAILEAVEQGKISKSRYDSFRMLTENTGKTEYPKPKKRRAE